MRPLLAFDLGNVLLPFDHMRACELMGAHVGLSAKAVYSLVFSSGLARQYEIGKLSSAQFIDACQDALGSELAPELIRRAWSDIFSEDVPMRNLVESLADRADLCLVSNTNELHFNWVLQRFPIVSIFQTMVLSYRVGALKPDRAIYEAAAQHVRQSQTAVYIDDIQAYALASEAYGFHGIWFRGHDQLRERLQDLLVT